METARFCTECGTVLESDGAARPYCPGCVLRQGLEREPLPGATPARGRAPAPPPGELQPFFERLDIQELLGRGGMGWVYRAWQKDLCRPVALKVLPADVTEEEGFRERFQREARALARLNHPHVVAVHEYGEAGDYLYLVMEYVDGVNLRAVLQEGPVPAKDALGMVAQICAALEYAHRQGVVHRDVKPENVLIDKAGTVKMADFGLARLVGDLGVEPSLTASHQVLGTPHYMAPEQWERPTTVDQRADLYGLGVMLYELLTGELPLGRFDPPSARAGVDERLDAIVMRALEKAPERRYQTAAQFQEDVVQAAAAPLRARPGVPAAAAPRPARPSGSGHSYALLALWGTAIGTLLGVVGSHVEPMMLWITASAGVILPALLALANIGSRIAWSYLAVSAFTVASFLLAVVLVPEVAFRFDRCINGDPLDTRMGYSAANAETWRYSVSDTREACAAVLAVLLVFTVAIILARRIRPLDFVLRLFGRTPRD